MSYIDIFLHSTKSFSTGCFFDNMITIEPVGSGSKFVNVSPVIELKEYNVS